MPRFYGKTMYYWSEKETEQRNTARHQTFKNELYKLALAGTSKEKFAEKLKELELKFKVEA